MSTWWMAAIVAAVLLGLAGYERVQEADANLRAETCVADRATDAAKSAQAVTAEQAKDRVEEQRRAAANQEIADAYEKKLAAVTADRVIADAATGRLQQRYAAVLAASRAAASNSTPVPPGTSASAPDLPADMFSGLVEIARQYRDAAEAALAAGERAEAQYDGLTPPAVAAPSP